MKEVKAPDFFEYIEDGKMREDAPESAKKAFRAWKRDNPMKVSIKKEIVKKLKDPNLPREEKNELIELLYEGIEFKEQG